MSIIIVTSKDCLLNAEINNVCNVKDILIASIYCQLKT